MKKLQMLVAAGAVALLAGCGSQQASNVTTVVESQENVVVSTNEAVDNAVVANGTAATASTLILAADGLGVALADGRSQRAGFAAPRDLAVEIVAGALGKQTDQGTNPECGAGPLDNVDFAGGLTMFFQDGKFVGWDIDGRDGSPYKTGAGIGIGSTVQALRDAGDVAIQDTSLGVEFTAGEISGLLTANRPDGKITNLWAGTTCAFR
jgi:hypothetical protein